MSAHTARFELVGCRFPKIAIDESRYEAKGPTSQIQISIGSSDPILSKGTLKGRPVIELAVGLDVRQPQNRGSKRKAATQSELVSIICVGGFVGRNPSDDGNLELFLKGRDDFARSLYWVVRQRLAPMLTTTRFRSVHLPWDIDETARADSKPPTRSRKRRGAPKGK